MLCVVRKFYLDYFFLVYFLTLHASKCWLKEFVFFYSFVWSVIEVKKGKGGEFRFEGDKFEF